MTWRRRLRRRLLWAGVLLGLVVLLATVSVLRVLVWSRSLIVTANNGGVATAGKGGMGMSRKLTIVAATGLIALATTASTALAVGTPDAIDRAAAAQQKNMIDARERALGPKYELSYASDIDADAFAQAVASSDSRPEPVRDDWFRLHPARFLDPVIASSSGRDLEWPQLGIGFGLGVLLAAGLWLAMRMTRARPFAH